MSIPPIPRVPPRFVPTLTEVVKESTPAGADSSRAALSRERLTMTVSEARVSSSRFSLPSASAKQPDISSIDVGVEAEAGGVPHATAIAQEQVARPVLTKDFEELLVHRVMQRVDISLDIRLRGAIATVVEEQTRSIVPRLREEIEAVVRHAVYEAVADELAADVHAPPL